MPERPVVVVSNRGPLSFALAADGSLRTRKAGGGLVTALGPAVEGTGADWVAAALTEPDRAAAATGVVEAEGYRLHQLVPDADDYRAFYDVVSNATLWFLHHGLWDTPRRPRFDSAWWRAWDAFRRVNDAFAAKVVSDAPEGADVLVQDYHLSLVGPRLVAERPDLRTVHFHHTPFTGPEDLRILPDRVARELLEGLTAFGACGFHAERWAANFAACAEAVLGRTPTTFVSPAAADAEDITAVAASEACTAAAADLERLVGDRLLLVRVDRIELSKNIVRGFVAFDELLERHPEWRERVVFGAFVYPSREGLADYLAYRHEVESVIARVNARWGTPSWTPIVYDPTDDFPRSVAALRRYDALVVNPVRDGLNLVAKEGAIVNERDGVLLLSPESGVWTELGPVSVPVHPYDITGAAEAMHRALGMGADERRALAADARRRATARTAADWLADLVAAAV